MRASDLKIEVISVRDTGDLLVAALRNRAHGGGCDTPLEEIVWQVAEWRDEKVIRCEMFRSEEEALKAAGAAGVGPTASDGLARERRPSDRRR